ncbi:hypothetical protein [Curtobacterium sp. MCJR17_043]|nr:hypothetical protein [Curtobacterium sp. MCJR17_043]WIB36873.1 hypothetical protein DEJ15_07755 [Curtobacterium sp. MCJR17_043]
MSTAWASSTDRSVMLPRPAAVIIPRRAAVAPTIAVALPFARMPTSARA